MKADTYTAKGAGPFDGTLALLWAILASGIQDYCNGVRRGALQSRDFRSARAWIFAQRGTLTAFESLCGVFDLDAAKLRAHLLRFELTRGREAVSVASLLGTRAAAPPPEAFGEAWRQLPVSQRAALD